MNKPVANPATVIAASPGFELLAAYRINRRILVNRSLIAWRIADDALPVPITLEAAPKKALSVAIKQPEENGAFDSQSEWLADVRQYSGEAAA